MPPELPTASEDAAAIDVDDAATIRRARPCSKCGYNLYSLPREGSCPECGQVYKRRAHDAKAKNPNRQLGQLRPMLQRREKAVRWLPAWWAVAVCAVTACYIFEARRGWWILAIIAVIVTGLRHMIAMFERADLKRRIEQIDAMARAE